MRRLRSAAGSDLLRAWWPRGQRAHCSTAQANVRVGERYTNRVFLPSSLSSCSEFTLLRLRLRLQEAQMMAHEKYGDFCQQGPGGEDPGGRSRSCCVAPNIARIVAALSNVSCAQLTPPAVDAALRLIAHCAQHRDSCAAAASTAGSRCAKPPAACGPLFELSFAGVDGLTAAVVGGGHCTLCEPRGSAVHAATD